MIAKLTQSGLDTYSDIILTKVYIFLISAVNVNMHVVNDAKHVNASMHSESVT